MADDALDLGPIEVDLVSFKPTGWYGTFATGRPWWQFWKPKTKFVSGTFTAGANGG